MTEHPDILDDARTHLEGITPGDWRWRGNTDHHGDVELCTYLPGKGRVLVLGTLPEHPTREDATNEWERGEMSEYLSCEAYVEQRVNGEPIRYLAFGTPEYRMVTGRERAVYEVARAQGAPDDTPRDHPLVYRADVDGVRNSNAEFIAAAPRLVRALADEVSSLRAELSALR